MTRTGLDFDDARWLASLLPLRMQTIPQRS